MLSKNRSIETSAPDAPFILLDGEDSAVLGFLKNSEKDSVILCYDDEISDLDGHKLISVGSRDDLSDEAHRLFSALRDADRMSPSVIYGHLPKQDGIGLALYNRMLRAAAHTVKHI